MFDATFIDFSFCSGSELSRGNIEGLGLIKMVNEMRAAIVKVCLMPGAILANDSY